MERSKSLLPINNFLENQLRESEAKYRSLVEQIPAVTYIAALDNTSTTLYVSPQIVEISGYDPDDYMKDPGLWDKHIYPEDHDKVLAERISSRVSGRPFKAEYRVFDKNRQILWVRDEGVVVKDNKGKPLFLQGIVFNITELRSAEEERKKAEANLQKAYAELETKIKERTFKLAEREEFLSNIFDSIQDGLSILDKEMNIIRVNATMEKWYEHSMPLVGKKCYQAYHGIKVPCKTCPTCRTLESGISHHEVVPLRGPGVKIEGWLDLFSFPLADPVTGEIIGAIEYVRDITEQRKKEREVIMLNKELLQSNRRLKQLALRDPLTGLYNHHYLQEVIEAEFYRARRYAHPISVLMLDVDYFKSVNDLYGHAFGDNVLKELAVQLNKITRRYDIVIRFGGEEFIIISPGITNPQALVLAGRILDAVNLYNFGNKKNTVKLKLSIAVASYPEDKANNGMELVVLTEKILNKAKERGGNRVYSSQDIAIEKDKQPSKNNKANSEIKFLKSRIEKLTKRSNQNLIESVFAFAHTLEAKDHATGAHVERTVKFANEIAMALNLSPEEIENIKQAAVLHDLGKVGISEKILLKKSKLNPKEYAQIKKHPQIGAEIIRPVQSLHNVIPLVLYHHERWDGKGYPAGLKAEEIPVGARIIALADVYEALVSDRPYRKAFSKAKALRIIKENSGSQFDPNIVDIFLRILNKEK